MTEIILRRVANVIGLVQYVQQSIHPRAAVRAAVLLGDRFKLFGGRAVTGFYPVQRLMSAGHEKGDFLYAPTPYRADYLTASYVPFLTTGPNHQVRRREIIVRTLLAREHLGELEELLASEDHFEHALLRFLFQQFGKISLDDADVAAVLDYRKWARRLIVLPNWLRTCAFRQQHERLQTTRRNLLARMEAAGEPFADSMFDLIWFKAAPMGYYVDGVMATLNYRPDLRAVVDCELGRPPRERRQTLALVRELIRLNPRPSTVIYVDDQDGEVKVAVLATATRDEERYANADQIDLDRHHDDGLEFARASPERSCPGHELAPEMIACVVAYELRR